MQIVTTQWNFLLIFHFVGVCCRGRPGILLRGPVAKNCSRTSSFSSRFAKIPDRPHKQGSTTENRQRRLIDCGLNRGAMHEWLDLHTVDNRFLTQSQYSDTSFETMRRASLRKRHDWSNVVLFAWAIQDSRESLKWLSHEADCFLRDLGLLHTYPGIVENGHFFSLHTRRLPSTRFWYSRIGVDGV